jgi:HK97 family phage major capsid protein
MSSEIAKRLNERRLQVVNEMRALVDKTIEEARDLSGEETGRYQAMNEEIGRIDERMSGILAAEQKRADTDAAFEKIGARPVTSPAGAPSEDGKTGEALRRFFLGESGRALTIPQSGTSFRALSKLTAAAGLNTVPTSFYDRLMAHLIETSGLLSAGPTVLNTSSGESLQIPKTTAHSTAAIVTEGAAIGTSEPTFGQLTLGAYKYGDLLQVSRELVADTGVDLEGYLSQQVGRALGNAIGAHLITGTGTGQPRGIVTDAATGVTGGAGVVGVPTADNLIDLMFSVIAPYRASSSCGWLVKDSTLATLRKIKDSTNQYIWQPGLQAGVPDMLLGKPIRTDPFVAATALSAKSVVFGDFSQYFVRFVGGGIRFEQSADYAFNTDLITYRAILRADAALVDLTGAVKVFVGNAA